MSDNKYHDDKALDDPNLRNDIFMFVAAQDHMQSFSAELIEHFATIPNCGYTRMEINVALSAMLSSGDLSIDDDGIITIGPETSVY